MPGTPNISVGMEQFNDTPLVNGAVYPTTSVDPKAYRFRILNAASDRFQNLDYDRADFETEAGAVYGEYRKDVTDPFFLLDETVRNLAYDVHTYKHSTMGFEADIKAMPEQYEYSISFFGRFYRPENVVIVITGDIDPGATMALIRKYYGPWQKGYVPPAVQPEPPQKAERTAEVSYGGKTLPILDIGFKGDAYDPDNRSFLAALRARHQTVVLVGFSMGGALSLWAAANEPVDGLVLAAPFFALALAATPPRRLAVSLMRMKQEGR